jgi:hypothetical protein
MDEVIRFAARPFLSLPLGECLASHFFFMNVALFGAGRIGKIHAANLARQPGVSLKYVVDISPDATAGLARQ